MSIYGWRWWNLAKDGSLQSVNNDLWPPGDPLHAECLFGNSGRHPNVKPPDYECHCGFWAFWDPELASGLPHAGYNRVAKVFGVIEAWGDIVEHELGFRAEWCIPRAVCVFRGRLHPAYEIPRYPNVEALLKVWDIAPVDDPHTG